MLHTHTQIVKQVSLSGVVHCGVVLLDAKHQRPFHDMIRIIRDERSANLWIPWSQDPSNSSVNGTAPICPKWRNVTPNLRRQVRDALSGDSGPECRAEHSSAIIRYLRIGLRFWAMISPHVHLIIDHRRSRLYKTLPLSRWHCSLHGWISQQVDNNANRCTANARRTPASKISRFEEITFNLNPRWSQPSCAPRVSDSQLRWIEISSHPIIYFIGHLTVYGTWVRRKRPDHWIAVLIWYWAS